MDVTYFKITGKNHFIVTCHWQLLSKLYHDQLFDCHKLNIKHCIIHSISLKLYVEHFNGPVYKFNWVKLYLFSIFCFSILYPNATWEKLDSLINLHNWIWLFDSIVNISIYMCRLCKILYVVTMHIHYTTFIDVRAQHITTKGYSNKMHVNCHASSQCQNRLFSKLKFHTVY